MPRLASYWKDEIDSLIRLLKEAVVADPSQNQMGKKWHEKARKVLAEIEEVEEYYK